ncbi:CDP-glycerol glycerophosphotransferase family protein [Terrisporobacter sp.]|uniref:CDP-glycerol glycerophosphotransferase family protein n=1 Tax=Terrisporobacter sp. TaxID=1965305 RepID=UPI00399680E4
MHYKLTFIIDNNVDNQDIESTLKSIINNNEQFLKFIKIIIVSNEKIDNLILKEINSYKKEKNIDISVEYYEDNFFEISNKLIENIDTEFVTFNKSGYIYPNNYIQCLLEKFKEESSKVDIIQIKNANSVTDADIIDLEISENKAPLRFWGLVFKYQILKEFKFNVKYKEIAGEDVFYKILLKSHKYLNINNMTDNSLLNDNSVEKEDLKKYWYLDFMLYLKDDLINYIENNIGYIPRYVQYILFDIVKSRFTPNLNNKNKHVIDDNIDEFLDICSSILKNISDDIILNQYYTKTHKISKELKIILIKLKYGNDFNPIYIKKNKSLFMCTNDNFLLDVTKERVRIDAMEYENNTLIIDFSSFGFVDAEIFKMICKYNNEKLYVEETFRYAHTKYFGQEFVKRNTFRVKIPKEKFINNSTLKFYILYEGREYQFRIEANRYTARITSHLSKTYWKFDDYIVSMPNRKSLKIENKTLSKCIKKEILMLLTCLKKSPQIFLLRLLYWIVYPVFKNKNIWLTYDKLYKGGDNGEYFYKYMMDQNDGIEGHYVINKKYPDAKRLQKEGYKPLMYGTMKHKLYFLYSNIVATTHGGVFKNKNIWLTYDKLYKGGDNGEYFYKYMMDQNDGIEGHYVINKKYPDAKRLQKEGYKPLMYGTMKHKLYFLYSNIVATTHGGVYNFNGFDNAEIKYFQDLLRSSVACIQHGLTVQDLAFNSNRLFNNMKRYYCASKYEIENLSKPIYGYEDKSILKLTGVPRYDGLKSNDKKQILITPTWRNYIALPVTKKEDTKPYYPGFKDTDYFKIYNKLISDDKLIKTAKKTGYQIIYLLHPVVSSQIDDYEKNENISIIQATEVNYEKILTESSLMVTDYSGVQFDFAYMRKPIVYYHHPKLPPHYKESGFSYEKLGFGEICDNNDELVNYLCEYMEDNCNMKEFYKKRADDFFEFSDYNNCKRIYDDLKDYQSKIN